MVQAYIVTQLQKYFIIYSGRWRFYWGAEGKDETILNAGDIISMPTNMFRAFENAGDEEGLIFVVLGGDDPGIITWVPSVLEKSKKNWYGTFK